MARVRIMYWKEIPVQIQAEDATGKVSKQLADRLQKGVDAISMFDGSAGTDNYLDAWEWGEYEDMDGSAEAAATVLANSINRGFPKDFVKRVRALHESGNRNTSPGTFDDWQAHVTG